MNGKLNKTNNFDDIPMGHGGCSYRYHTMRNCIHSFPVSKKLIAVQRKHQCLFLYCQYNNNFLFSSSFRLKISILIYS